MSALGSTDSPSAIENGDNFLKQEAIFWLVFPIAVAALILFLSIIVGTCEFNRSEPAEHRERTLLRPGKTDDRYALALVWS